jgi:hypothetical protein
MTGRVVRKEGHLLVLEDVRGAPYFTPPCRIYYTALALMDESPFQQSVRTWIDEELNGP